MNRKELVQRWRNALGYGQKEMFYYPVKDNKSKGDFSPMILEVEVSVEKGKTDFNLYTYGGTGINYIYKKDLDGIYFDKERSLISSVLYNLRDQSGKKITKSEYLNILRSTYSEEYEYDSLELLYEEFEPFLQVDWGDGTVNDYTKQLITATRQVELNNTIYMYDAVIIPTNNKITHSFSKSGRYIIKISANIWSIKSDSFNIQLEDSSSCYLKKINKWGNLKLRTLNYLFNHYYNINSGESYDIEYTNIEYIQPFSELNNNEFYYIISAYDAFYNYRNELWSMSDIIGDGGMKNLPNIEYATEMFYGSNIEIIPSNFLQYNIKLRDITSMCSNSPSLKLIGNNACANLPRLLSNAGCFVNNNNLITVGDSIFENNINLGNLSGNTNVIFYKDFNLKNVGNYIFNNCINLKTSKATFGHCYSLEQVGNGIFYNCYKLENVDELFFLCVSLTNVGYDLFKNCYSINSCFSLFYACPKVKIPDRLFYDLKCTESNYQARGTYKGTNIRLEIELLYYSPVEFDKNCIVLPSYFGDGEIPDQIKSEYSNYTMETFPYITLGKEMFSPRFLSELQLYNSAILMSSQSYYYINRMDYSNPKCTVYSSNLKGEAIPIWETPQVFRCENNVCSFGVTESIFCDADGNSRVFHKPQFDNVDKIPLPKLFKRVYEDNSYDYYISSKQGIIFLYMIYMPSSSWESWECEFEEVNE